MARVICRHCQTEIPPDDVNVGEGVAYCRACNELSRLAEMLGLEDDDHPTIDLSNPPDGCRVRDEGSQLVVTASARSLGGAAGALFFALFWNGLLSVFVVIAIAQTVSLAGGTLPGWFPAPSGSSNGFGGGVGGVLFLWLFLTPFIVVGVVVSAAAITSLFGRSEVILRGGMGRLRTGVGPFTWGRRFDASNVQDVRLGLSTWTKNDQRQPTVIIDTGKKKIRFGSLLKPARRAWMATALRELLVTRPRP